MDEIAKQMAALSTSQKGKSGSFLDVLGADLDSSYDRNIIVDVV